MTGKQKMRQLGRHVENMNQKVLDGIAAFNRGRKRRCNPPPAGYIRCPGCNRLVWLGTLASATCKQCGMRVEAAR